MTRPGEFAKTFAVAISRHDPELAAACFAEDYEDEAPARRGELVRGRNEVRANIARLIASMPDVNATILDLVERGDEVWMEWRLSGTRDDGSAMEFVGVTSSAWSEASSVRAASTPSSPAMPVASRPSSNG